MFFTFLDEHIIMLSVLIRSALARNKKTINTLQLKNGPFSVAMDMA